jgi:hypothetical protein
MHRENRRKILRNKKTLMMMMREDERDNLICIKTIIYLLCRLPYTIKYNTGASEREREIPHSIIM